MKKFLMLFVAATLAACSVESVENGTSDSLNSTANAKNGSTAAEAENPLGFYAGNSGNLKGTLAIWNDCDKLYLQITPTSENPDEVSIWLLNDLAELNGGKNQVKNVPAVVANEPTELLWTFPVGDFDLNAKLFIYVKAYSDYAGEVVQEKVSYTDFDFVFEDCGCSNELLADLSCGETNILKLTFTAEEAGPVVIQGGLTSGTSITEVFSNKLKQNTEHKSGNSNANVTRWEGDVEACEVITITIEFTGGNGVGDWTATREIDGEELNLGETEEKSCS